MKACIVQPPYSYDLSKSDEYFDFKIKQLKNCDDTYDIIVLPEYSDVPCVTKDLEETLYYHNKYIDTLLSECISTAKRCNALVFVNALSLEPTGYRNTTYVYNREGSLAGKYFKKHLPPLEFETLSLDSGYTLEPSEPYVIELEGVRYGFLTCYDFYFYEAFANIARNNVDIIIGCSLQRSDTHASIEAACRFLAYNTNAYVLRSSVSFAEDSDICGASMAVSPFGKVLGNMQGKFGSLTVSFDPHEKYYKPAGFGNPDSAHYEYIEKGRRPWKYRPSGSAISRHDDILPYPRVCAHRGFCTVAPENSMAAFGAAVGMGADEIEFDLWFTKDGEIVSSHDSTLERVSDGEGKIYDYTLEELKKLDFGAKFNEKFAGLRIVTFEDILKKFSCHTIMNIHVKSIKNNPVLSPAQCLEKIAALIHKYDCEKYVYLMSGEDDLMELAREVVPHLRRCMGAGKEKWAIVDRAIKYDCCKVQLFKPYFNQEMIDKAHAHGIKCNVFWSDDPDEAQRFIDMGIDTVLTNDFNLVNSRLKGNK